MVGASADSDSLFFEHTQAGGCLTCVENLAGQAGKAFLIAGGDSGYAAHALHYVEHQALGLQQRADGAFDNECDVARAHVGAVFDEHRHFQGPYCKENGKDLKIEQEVRNTDEIRQAIAAGVDRIMLDNFDPERTAEAVRIIRAET